MKHFYLTTAIALLASPALADVNPADLWQSWQEDFANLGVTLTAEPEQQDNMLVLRNVKWAAEFGFFTIDETIAEMRFTSLVDGSVAVDYSTTLTIDMSIDSLMGVTEELIGTGTMENAHGTITGTLNDYVLEFSIGRMTQSGEMNLQKNGKPPVNITMDIVFSEMTGRNHVVHGDTGVSLTYDFTMGGLESALVTKSNLGNDLTSEDVANTKAQGYVGSIAAYFPTPVEGSQGGSLIPQGLLLDFSLQVESTHSEQSSESPFSKMNMVVDEAQRRVAVNVDEQSVSLQGSDQSVSVEVTSSEFGSTPLGGTFDSGEIRISLPLRPLATPQDASFALSLSGVTANDAVWAMADPEGSLSHGPADFAIDTRASIDLLLDWTDFEAAKNLNSAPAILHSIKLQDFLIAIENARLTGVGVVEFSNDGPVPEPNGGMINFTLDGVNALLDKLGTLPLVDPSLTAGAKGMLGMFTASSGGPDSLKSVIEFFEGGHVSINGQRVR